MNRYDRYPGDYLRDTMDLSMLEDGAYTRLLDWYYANERPVPDSRKFQLVRATSDEEREITQWVLDRFFRSETKGGEVVWVHDRVEAEIAKAQPKIQASRTNGKRGGRPRKSASSEPEKNPPGNPTGILVANPVHNPQETYTEKEKEKDLNKKESGPHRLQPDWDPGFGVLTGAGIPDWAHPELLKRFRAYHCNGDQERNERNWRQSYARWAAGEWQKNRPQKPEPEVAPVRLKQFTPEELDRMRRERYNLKGAN